jgi:hypothetical protein
MTARCQDARSSEIARYIPAATITGNHNSIGIVFSSLSGALLRSSRFADGRHKNAASRASVPADFSPDKSVSHDAPAVSQFAELRDRLRQGANALARIILNLKLYSHAVVP